jgi:Fe-S cluster biogenesis protein NfuA
MEIEMKDKIQQVLEEKVNPVLAEHFGGANLVSYEEGIAKVRLTGACSTCPSAQFTIEDVVKQILMANIPEIEDVILDTSVSDDLIEMARKILNKQI